LKLEGRYRLEASPQIVWQTLTDPDAVARCIPGLEKLVPIGEETYEAVVKSGVGTMSGSLAGRVFLGEKQPPRQFEFRVEGRSLLGFGRGEGLVRLEAQPDGQTLVIYQGEAQVGGTLALVGERAIGAAVMKMLDEFFEAIRRQLPSSAPEP
jgi:hypothetical protein